MLRITASGFEAPQPGGLSADDVLASLRELEAALQAEDRTWAEVSLLWLSNSTLIAAASPEETRIMQDASDVAILTGLTTFAAEREWQPSFIGSTVRASFFAGAGRSHSDISNGLLWAAFTGISIPRAPVGIDVSRSPGSRAQAGSAALDAALALAEIYFREHPQDRPTEAEELARSSLGLVLTSGSGHVESKVEIDFKDCYAVGQMLKARADALGVTLAGGCASNRSPDQSQALYYSERSLDGYVYRSTVKHAAVVALLPYARALMHLQHPYKKLATERLNLDFHEHEAYAPGRYFCVRAINGATPSDFLRDNGWEITEVELNDMVDNHLPIPTQPKAHKVSIASAPPDVEASLWPNVPVWFEKVGDDLLLRLVRAEAQDSDFFLVGMQVDDLVSNAAELADLVSSHSELEAGLLAFLCESRKYVLADAASNAEAETLIRGAGATTVVGAYVNGEYSTGDFRSIGYHNYSQIGLLLSDQ